VAVSGNQETITPVAHPSEDRDVNRKLGEGVIETLRAEGQVLVVIVLRPPRAPLTDLPAVKQAIARLQERVLAALSPSAFRLVQKYEAVPSLSGWVLHEDSLTILAANPHVVRIDVDVGGSGGGSRH